MNRFLSVISVLAVTLVSACASGSDFIGDQSAIISQIRTTQKADRAARRSPPTEFKVTRALLNESPQPFLEVKLENIDSSGYLVPIAFRNDGRNGKVAVWSTENGQHVILRNGVLIGTKGLGGDLASADASLTVNAIRGRTPAQGPRTLYVRGSDNRNFPIDLQCTLSVLGAESIEILGKNISTVRIQEQCHNQVIKITNDYWVDGKGSVPKSRQWAGPNVGFLTVLRLEK